MKSITRFLWAKAIVDLFRLRGDSDNLCSSYYSYSSYVYHLDGPNLKQKQIFAKYFIKQL